LISQKWHFRFQPKPLSLSISFAILFLSIINKKSKKVIHQIN
jgi:hypothetical protein